MVSTVLGTKHRLTRFFHLIFLLCLTLLSPAPRAAEIIVNRLVHEGELALNVVRLVFTMRLLRWQDGSRIRVFVLPDDHPLHREFAKKSLNLYPRQLRRVWDRNLYSGSGPIPVEIPSVEDMERLVATTPGAIGYLPDGRAGEGVKVIHVR